MKKFTVEVPYQITVVASIIAENEDEAISIAEDEISTTEYVGDTVGAESDNDNVIIENVIAGDCIGSVEISDSVDVEEGED